MKLAYDGMTQKQVSDVYKYDIRVDLGDKVTDEQKTELTVMRINGFSIKQTRGYLA